jgi:putative transposase
MSQAISPSTGRAYSLMRVSHVWGIARSTVYEQLRRRPTPKRRRGPVGPCSDEELVEHIKSVLSDSLFHGEGYRKVWARLRYRGIRTSKGRVLRLMRENGLLAPQRPGHPHGPKAHDGTITTERVDEIWGTDMTGAFTTKEGQAAIFLAVDHCSMECMGIHAAKFGTRFEALESIRQGIREQFGAFGKYAAVGLVLRHDHRSQYMSDVFQKEIRFLGIKSSPAFFREPQGNGCAERFVRILKENLLWVRSFETVEELRTALIEFKQLYNETWILERHGYKTPAQIRREQRDHLAEAA